MHVMYRCNDTFSKECKNFLSMLTEINNFDGYEISEFTLPSDFADSEFHPNGRVTSFTLDDEYFLDLRADHFIVIEGNEVYSGMEPAILLLANHKGQLLGRLIHKPME